MKAHIGQFLSHAPDPGGTTTTLQGISLALTRIGHKVTIYCCGKTPTSGFRDELANEPGVRIIHHRSSSRNPFSVPMEIGGRIQANQDKVDLLLIHGLFNPKNVTVARAAKKAGIPYVACPTSLYHPQMLQKGRLRKFVFGQLYEKPLLQGAVAIQAFTDLQRGLLDSYGIDKPMFVVPNGFDPRETVGDAPDDASLWLGADPRILYLGRIDMHTKGLDMLLKALATGITTKALPPSLQITLIGPDCGDEARLQRFAARLGIRDNVRFLGRVDDRTRWSVIRSCSIMVLPSRHDAFPTTMIEALASGKPVIVSEQTGISKLVEVKRCGYVVRPDPESICEGLARALASSDEWPGMGARGREAVRRDLAWDVIAQHASTYYEQLWRQRSITGLPTGSEAS
jgi:glycosyltransferase involved in cell wall biosynthesis